MNLEIKEVYQVGFKVFEEKQLAEKYVEKAMAIKGVCSILARFDIDLSSLSEDDEINMHDALENFFNGTER